MLKHPGFPFFKNIQLERNSNAVNDHSSNIGENYSLEEVLTQGALAPEMIFESRLLARRMVPLPRVILPEIRLLALISYFPYQTLFFPFAPDSKRLGSTIEFSEKINRYFRA